jgi:sirohydrochlorin ferrochelatase
VIRGLADAWRARSGWRDVLPAYAAATGPTVAEAVAELRAAGAPRVAVASYVLAPGRLPDRMVAVRALDLPVSEPLGDAPELAAVVLARYDAARATGAVVPAC